MAGHGYHALLQRQSAFSSATRRGGQSTSNTIRRRSKLAARRWRAGRPYSHFDGGVPYDARCLLRSPGGGGLLLRAVDARRRVTRRARVASRVARKWRGVLVTALSRLFRFGTPALVVLCSTGQVPWWLILGPVLPVWCSFVTTTHDAHRRARIIRRPRRALSLGEAASERRVRFADAALNNATAERSAALYELAKARAKGDVEAQVPSWRQRGRTLVERARRGRSA